VIKWAAKLVGLVDHRMQHPSDLTEVCQHESLLFLGQIAAVEGDVRPMLGFQLFRVRIGQFTYEVTFILPLPLCFRDLGADGT
jgi:hypothetical protein